MPSSTEHGHFNRLKRALKQVGVPCHEHSGTFRPPDSRFPGIWLEPDGVHFVRKLASPGRLAHEAAHYALVSPVDRQRLGPGCLSDMNITTCGEDFACEAWEGALATLAKVPIEELFFDIEDYQYAVGEVVDEWQVGMKIALELLQKEHPGVVMLTFLGLTTMESYPEMNKWFADSFAVSRQQLLQRDCADALKSFREETC